ncbi:MAG: glutamine synthetase adenylyltransferase [Planctomycetaceae bacterium]|nr:glutamine synthetase adenylyltransferase [Planctomycetaceae bacterium]
MESTLLGEIELRDKEGAARTIRSMISLSQDEEAIFEFLPKLISAIQQTSSPDLCLSHFERFLRVTQHRDKLLSFLSNNPRAVEILVRIFLNSQYLTQILIKVPEAVYQFIVREDLVELKSREQYRDEALQSASNTSSYQDRLDAFRRYQHQQILRLGTCDAFGLLDFRSVTVQLSLLADGLVQACLSLITQETGLSLDGFVVLACGKLGGEELNYSSDIDLLFLSEEDPVPFWPLGQKLIQALTNASSEGFLYRVDMRLRPWGASGPLVNSVEASVNYLKNDARHWERQALVKARVIAGDQRVGAKFLKEIDKLVFDDPPPDLREQIRSTKENIERKLLEKGTPWGEVKSGAGSIRDVEFITQYLQLKHGGKRPELRTFNTLEGLIRLADFGFIRPDEYRQLTTGYLFLRNVEHALQLMHNKQLHQLPQDAASLDALAIRLDFPSRQQFEQQYESHSASIRKIFESHLGSDDNEDGPPEVRAADRLLARLALSEPDYQSVFSDTERVQHLNLLSEISEQKPIAVTTTQLEGDETWQLIVVGYDARGILSLICGLLFAGDWNVLEGRVFTDEDVGSVDVEPTGDDDRNRVPLFLNFFKVQQQFPEIEGRLKNWSDYESELTKQALRLQCDEAKRAQASVARQSSLRVGRVASSESLHSLQPVRYQVDNISDSKHTILHIQSEDTPGFLYELTNALTLSNVNIVRMIIGSEQELVQDTMYITDREGNKLNDDREIRELTTAVLLVKHCMHLLPAAPNPEVAWLHLRDFLEKLFSQSDWYEQMGDLERPDRLESLTRILGVSHHLWQDFLRLHHDSVLPFVQNVDQLSQEKSESDLRNELEEMILAADGDDAKKEELNRFKDRETFRTDMRHILGYIPVFGQFSEELTRVCDVVLEAALKLAEEKLERRYGVPIDTLTGQPCPFAILALGKCGGKELGFASDIELMFLYEGDGKTNGPRSIREVFYFERLIKEFRELIVARREGIFELDFRLRPYGSAGSLAVSVEAFKTYFAPDGPAWPFERQALVKLRPITGHRSLSHKILAIRDQLIFCGQSFDVTAMHGMREKQVMQLVDAGGINAKLSPGGLVDIEYLVQGLQIAHGEQNTSIRVPHTLKALEKLRDARILTEEQSRDLSEAYKFLRKLIDALRMVRGNARDLAIPPQDSDEFEFLARRLEYSENPRQLIQTFESYGARVLELMRQLEEEGLFEAPGKS